MENLKLFLNMYMRSLLFVIVVFIWFTFLAIVIPIGVYGFVMKAFSLLGFGGTFLYVFFSVLLILLIYFVIYKLTE